METARTGGGGIVGRYRIVYRPYKISWIRSRSVRWSAIPGCGRLYFVSSGHVGVENERRGREAVPGRLERRGYQSRTGGKNFAINPW